MTALTAKQSAELERIVTEAREVYGVGIGHVSQLDIVYAEETRPGRGHSLRFYFLDGEYALAGSSDVYGYAEMYVAHLAEIHNSYDEECACKPCRTYRDADEPEQP